MKNSIKINKHVSFDAGNLEVTYQGKQYKLQFNTKAEVKEPNLYWFTDGLRKIAGAMSLNSTLVIGHPVKQGVEDCDTLVVSRKQN